MAILGTSQSALIGGGVAHGKFCIAHSHVAAGADSVVNERLVGFKSVVAAMPACRLIDHGTCGGHSIRPS